MCVCVHASEYEGASAKERVRALVRAYLTFALYVPIRRSTVKSAPDCGARECVLILATTAVVSRWCSPPLGVLNKCVERAGE
jgi:hypothetical protein